MNVYCSKKNYVHNSLLVLTTVTQSCIWCSSTITVFVQHYVVEQHSAIRYTNIPTLWPDNPCTNNRNKFESASSFGLFTPSALPRLFCNLRRYLPCIWKRCNSGTEIFLFNIFWACSLAFWSASTLPWIPLWFGILTNFTQHEMS